MSKLLNNYEEKFINLKMPDFIKEVSDEEFEMIKEVAKIIGINKDVYDFLRLV